MIRFVLACVFYTAIVQWGYKEISLIFPDAVPYLTETAKKIEIPTHDTWSRAGVKKYVAKAAVVIADASDAVEEISEFVSEANERMESDS